MMASASRVAAPTRPTPRAARPRRAARVACAAARRFFVGGNWKSNCTKTSVTKLVGELNDAVATLPAGGDAEIVVAPEHIHLSMVLDDLDKRYSVAAQNCWKTSGGAYTGEVSGEEGRIEHEKNAGRGRAGETVRL